MYTVKPFSGPRYHKNRDKARGGQEPCAICGKPITNPATAAVAPVINGGADWGKGFNDLGESLDDESDPGYMGCFSIGPDCDRRYRVKGGA